MDAQVRTGSLVERGQGSREIEVGIGGDQLRQGKIRGMLRDKNRGGLGVFKLVRVLGIGEKRELGGGGVFHTGHAGNFDRGVAMELAREGTREVGKSHDYRVTWWGSSFCWLPSV